MDTAGAREQHRDTPRRAAASGARPFDRGVLDKLAEDLRDEQPARTFARRYLDLLDARVDRVCGTLEAEDDAQALDATLSLKVSSSTVGAPELARLAETIEQSVRRQRFSTARRVAAGLADAASRCRTAMSDYLDQTRGD